MFYYEIFAGDSFSLSMNVALSNTMSWIANGLITTLDINDIFISNTNVGQLTANLTPIVSNLPNTINYTLTLTANASATQTWMANSVSNIERKLYLFTKFISNTGIVVHGNSAILIVKASYDTSNSYLNTADPFANNLFDAAPSIYPVY